MSGIFDIEINSFAERISSAKEDIRHADSISLNPSITVKNQAARIKSSIIVQLAAGFENLLTLLLQKLNLELSKTQTCRSEIHTSLLSIELNSFFASLKSTDGINNWSKRVEFLSETCTPNTTILPSTISVLGSKTPRRKHLTLLWEIYSIKHPASPSLAHLLALDSLADSRNEIAHGSVSATVAGKKKTTIDLENMITKIEELGLHIACCFENYLKNKEYKKTQA